jgi:hypothetical protein
MMNWNCKIDEKIKRRDKNYNDIIIRLVNNYQWLILF